MTGPSRLPGSPVGLYVHIPFCRHLCPYCDFAVAVRRKPPHEEYCDALIAEWRVREPDLAGRELRTLYFGGGTPGYWTVDALARFVGALDVGSSLDEVTLEANPHDVTPDRLEAWADVGIDRVSLGVQSFDDRYLEALGRDHDGARARAALGLLRESSLRTSVDLIYGGPGHAVGTLRRDLDEIVRAAPDHVSVYELTVEPRTVFGRRHRAGELALPAREVEEELGQTVVDVLASARYERYEVSSYGRNGDVGIHNAGYWLGAEYVGLGTGAHSLRIGDDVVRRANRRRLREYMRNPADAAEVEPLEATAHLGERLFLAARNRLGISWDELRTQFGHCVDATVWGRVESAVELLGDRGWIERSGDVLRATESGLDFADDSAAVFWDAVTAT